MKQIIPFQNELLFKTKVSEITSISLEHTLSLTSDEIISGEFYISGDYKMTEGSINREKFDFTLPFDIALDARYDMNSIVIDIDNFYYEVVNNESLKVNIDVYVEGNKIVEEPVQSDVEEIDNVSDIEESIERKDENEDMAEDHDESRDEDVRDGKSVEYVEDKKAVSEFVDTSPEVVIDREENLDESVQYHTPKTYYLEEDSKEQKDMEFNIFENIDHSDTYVTYHVYIVKESDTIDTIIQKYGVTKEDISIYNDLEDIKPGTKLIIPNANE